MNYTDKVHLVMGCTSAVSVVMCAIAISMVIFLRLYKHFMYRLASYQVIGALLTNVAIGLVFLQLARVNNNCRIVAFINVYFVWIELLLTLGMTTHVFSYVMCRKSLAHLEWFYVAASFLVPLLYSWVPFVTGNYGEDPDNECGISITNTNGFIEESTLHIGPFLLLMTLDMVFVLVMVFYVRYRSRKHRSSVMSSSLNNPYEEYRRGLAYMSPLLAYPIIFFVIILLLSALIVVLIVFRKIIWFSFVAVAVISSFGWIAGLVLMCHVCYSHVYKRGTMVPFETDRRLLLVEDSEK